MYTSPVVEITSTIEEMAFALLYFMSLLAQPCFAFREDTLNLSTQAGAAMFTESFEVSRHFFKPDDSDSNYFLRRRSEGEEVESKNHQALPVSWNLGFSYSRMNVPATTTGPSIMDEIYSVRAGIEGEPLQNLEASLQLAVDAIPSESYRHGNATFRFEYTIPIRLKKKPPKKSKGKAQGKAALDDDDDDEDYDQPKYKGDDASEYFKDERERKLLQVERDYRLSLLDPDLLELPPSRRKPQHYPNIRIALNWGFNIHQVEAKVFKRRASLGAVLQNATLYQYETGPEVSYSPNDRWTFTARVNFFHYNNDVDTFNTFLESGNVVNAIGAVGLANQIFAFPEVAYTAAVDWYPNDKNSFSFGLSYNTYISVAQFDAIGFNPVYYRELGKRWRLGVGADLNYSLAVTPNPLSFLGALEIIYKL